MDLAILKKKISSYRTPKGRITNLPDDLLGEILFAWEQWTGPGSGFYSAIGADHRKMASLIGRAKKLKREGAFNSNDFAEVKVINHGVESVSLIQGGIELLWKGQHIIKFSQVGDLILFLEKVDNQNNKPNIEIQEVA